MTCENLCLQSMFCSTEGTPVQVLKQGGTDIHMETGGSSYFQTK